MISYDLLGGPESEVSGILYYGTNPYMAEEIGVWLENTMLAGEPLALAELSNKINVTGVDLNCEECGPVFKGYDYDDAINLHHDEIWYTVTMKGVVV